MWGLAFGLPAGLLLFCCLRRFVNGLTGTGQIPLVSGLCFVFLPPAVLLLTALLSVDWILWCGVGMTAVLVVAGTVAFCRQGFRQTKKPLADDSNEKEGTDA